jgi:protein gp37
MPTKISWCDETWNPTLGCAKVDDDCLKCYAIPTAHRNQFFPKITQLYTGLTRRYPDGTLNWTGAVRTVPERLPEPYGWKRPRRIFVNSMSDLFHPDVPDAFIAQVFDVMVATPRHTYLILTKRPERAAAWPGPWPANIQMGVSVGRLQFAHRIDALRPCGAQLTFLSAEPLIGSLAGIDLAGIGWVIAGGESGPNHRPMDMAWARELRNRCVELGIPFFFKQDADRRNEQRPWIVEEDGSCWEWHQWPGHVVPPRRIR